MEITPELKLVVPVRQDEEGNVTVYGYHSPISREVFEANYRVLAATHAALFSKGGLFAATTGPQIAALSLRDEGKRDAASRGDYDANGQPLDGGAGALLAEIKRLTMVLLPGANGWEMLPIDAAISSGKIDFDEWREAESAIVFFTVGCALATRAAKKNMAVRLAQVMGASTTSSNATDFCASLARLTQGETIAAKAASSVPC